VYALINLYDDVQFLAACLESIKNFVSHIVVADGAYALYFEEYKKSFPAAAPWSTDGSLEVVKALKDMPDLTILSREGPWENQVVKRNALVEDVPDDEWFMIIDADEGLIMDVERGFTEIESSGCVCARVPLINLGASMSRMQYFWHPRFFRKMPGMHYGDTHWKLRDKFNRIIEDCYPIWWTDAMVMVHYKLLKDPRRVQPHHAYMNKLSYRGWMEPENKEVKIA